MAPTPATCQQCEQYNHAYWQSIRELASLMALLPCAYDPAQREHLLAKVERAESDRVAAREALLRHRTVDHAD